MEVNLKDFDLCNPTPEHAMLRETLKAFVQSEVEPQALEHDRKEKFNLPLFRKLGELGLLGITVPEEYGGAGMDAIAATIVHEENIVVTADGAELLTRRAPRELPIIS